MKPFRLVIAALAFGLGGLLPPPAAEAAVWQVAADGTGDFTTIQAAVDAAVPGDVIEVAAGSYREQVVVATDDLLIRGAGRDLTFIDSPAALSSYFVIGAYYFPVVLVKECDGVVFADLTLDGRGQGDLNFLFQGFGFFNAGGGLEAVDVTGVRGAVLGPVPHGNGVFAVAVDGAGHDLALTDVDISDFQKSGVVLDGPGLHGTLTGVTVTGAGTTAAIPQNGIQVSRGADASLDGCVVADLTYTGGVWSATGLLGIAGTTVAMAGCGATACQQGIYMEDNQASFAAGFVAAPTGDALTVASSGAKALADRLVPLPLDIAVDKTAAAAGGAKAAAGLTVTGSVFAGSGLAGSWGPAAVAAGTVTLVLEGCEVSGFDRGFVILEEGGSVAGQARDCSFAGNLALGGWSNSLVDYDARGNWWGHISGPYHPLKNPGGLGAEVTDHILFDPWTIVGPGIVATAPGPEPIGCGVAKPVTVTYLPDPAGPPTRGYEITFRITGPGAAAAADVADAGGLAAVGEHQFFAVDNPDGSVTVSDALIGTTAGLLTPADVFVVDVRTSGDGTVGFELVSCKLRDLVNQPLYAPLLGTQFPVDCLAPAPVTGITAAPGHNRVTVTWIHDDAEVDHYEIFRGLWHDGTPGVSAYPEYDDLPADAVPARPATWAEAQAGGLWEPAGTTPSGVHVFVDQWPDASGRGVYAYEVFAVDAVLNGQAAAANDRSTNYWLGDVAGQVGDPDPDGLVDVKDMTLLGANFGRTVPLGDATGILDVGPTDDWSRLGVPLTDSRIDFEDLVVFAMNFGVVTAAKAPAPPDAQVRLAWVGVGDGAWALRLVGGAGLQALRVQAVRPVARVSVGGLLDRQDAPCFLRNVGADLDASLAILGTGRTFVGTGDLLVVHAAGPLAAADLTFTARGPDNRTLGVTLAGGGAEEPPAAFALTANRPNPFNPATTLGFDLPAARHVRLAVYAVDGRKVATLVDEVRPAGRHEVLWSGRGDDGRPAAAGVYFARIEAGPWREVRKMTLVK